MRASSGRVEVEEIAGHQVVEADDFEAVAEQPIEVWVEEACGSFDAGRARCTPARAMSTRIEGKIADRRAASTDAHVGWPARQRADSIGCCWGQHALREGTGKAAESSARCAPVPANIDFRKPRGAS